MRSRSVIACLLLLLPALVGLGVTLPGCSSPGDGSGSPSVTTAAGAADAGLSATTESSTTTISTTTTLSPGEVVLADMSLRQKAGQVLLLGFEGTTLLPTTSELLEAGPPGGLLLLGYNVEDAGQLRALTAELQQAAAAAGSPAGLLIAVDQEGGPVQRIREGVPKIPSARELGESSTPSEAGRLAAETAAVLVDLGVNMNLAPVADVVSDPGSFLYPRTYGGDPAKVGAFVESVTQAFAAGGVVPVVKHFPGHGSATGNTHGETVISDLTREEFEATHLPPFRAALAAGAECVMVAHIVAAAYDERAPASLSPAVVEGLLRERLGFTGVVLTDDLGMGAVLDQDASKGEQLGAAAVAALAAGCDLLISTETLARHKAMIDSIIEAVQTGTLSEGRLDEAVLRVLTLKARHGLLFP